MSGLFSSKSTSTSTQKVDVPKSFQAFLDTSLGRALSAGVKPFTQYVGQRIADLSSNEQAGIQGAGAQAGMYQPVINMALQANQDMFNNAAPTQTQLGNFINPYVNYVLGNSLDRLQEQSDINMTKIGSTAGMSGAFGGLRHGVLEGANLAELLKSARDLSGSTYADAYDKGMTNWFRTQENQRANIGNALDLVRGGQAYNMQDIQSLMSTGLTERTRNQAGLDFGYSEFMRQDQDDLNKASFLSTIAAQYPRDLFTRTNKTESTTTDSPLKTIAGIGLAAAGIMSGNPAAVAGLSAGSKALPTSPAFNTGSGISWGAPSTSGNMGGGNFSDPFWKFNKGGLVKKHANGGMVKAGLSMAAGMDPLEAVTEHMAMAKEDGQMHFGGGLMAHVGEKMGISKDTHNPIWQVLTRKKQRGGPSQRDSVTQPTQPTQQPFNWETFLSNMRFSDFTRPSPNTVNPSYLSNLSLPQGVGSYIPMTQQMDTPLNAGVPGPGGPAGLNGNNLNRFAKGGKVKSPAWQRKEGKNPEGGLNAKGRASYNRETGGNLKAPQPEGGSRRDSFCARMGGMKKKLTSSKTANDPNSRINKALRKWNCKAEGGLIEEYAGGGRVGPTSGKDLQIPKKDTSNWLAVQGILDMFAPTPVTNFESDVDEMQLMRNEIIRDKIQKEVERLTQHDIAKSIEDQNHILRLQRKAPASFSDTYKRQASPLDAMIAKLTNEVGRARKQNAEAMANNGEPLSFNEADIRKEDALRYLNESNPVFPKELLERPRPRKEYIYAPGTPPEELNKRRSSAPGYWPGGVEYANGGLVKKYQEGGDVFTEGGKGFSKRQDRLPPDTIDPLDALIYGLPNPNPSIIPDPTADRTGPLDFSPSSGTTSKAALKRNKAQTEVPYFSSPQDVINSLPAGPDLSSRKFTPTPMPMYSKSRMWDDVNEDVFMEGTFKNEQDNSINDKNLSLNKDSLAFGQHQYLPSTWNTYAARFMKENPELAKRLGVFKVKESELAKFRGKKGDPGIAKVIPSFAARDYVYRNYYLPDSVNALKKANLPVTELNLYLAHHLGQEGAVRAIPLMYDPKYEKKTMKQLLLDAGLTTAANSKGNPWGDSVAKYKRVKNAAYEPYRAKYRGETIDEILAKPYTAELSGEPVPFIDSNYISDESRNNRLNRKRTYRDEQRNLLRNDLSRGVNAQQMDGFIPGGMSFNKGGIVKKFNKGSVVSGNNYYYEQVNKQRAAMGLPPIEDVTASSWEDVASGFDEYSRNARENASRLIGGADNRKSRAANSLDTLTRGAALTIPMINDAVGQVGRGGANIMSYFFDPMVKEEKKFTPNPNLYSDPLGAWGNSGDPVDNFYNEMSDMIGTPQGGAPEMPEAAQVDGGGPNGGLGDSAVEDDPEVEMLKQLYRDKLKEYIDAQNKPAKKPVFGMFDNVNEPLLKLGLSLLASKGSFGEALGEAGLASLADRDKEQLKKGQEASEKLQEIVKMRYTNAMIDSLDPNIKAELARQAQAAKMEERRLQLEGDKYRADVQGENTRINEYLKYLMRLRDNDTSYIYTPEELAFAQKYGVPLSNPEDKGTSLFD